MGWFTNSRGTLPKPPSDTRNPSSSGRMPPLSILNFRLPARGWLDFGPTEVTGISIFIFRSDKMSFGILTTAVDYPKIWPILRRIGLRRGGLVLPARPYRGLLFSNFQKAVSVIVTDSSRGGVTRENFASNSSEEEGLGYEIGLFKGPKQGVS